MKKLFASLCLASSLTIAFIPAFGGLGHGNCNKDGTVCDVYDCDNTTGKCFPLFAGCHIDLDTGDHSNCRCIYDGSGVLSTGWICD